MDNRKLISIVCPVFNEELSIPLFYARLQEAVAELNQRYDIELLFTNNCSTDRTLQLIFELQARDPTISVLTMSRNFGYQASVMAGIRHASGDAIVVIDVDCEDPPEMIPEFVRDWECGFDIVYGERVKRSELYLLHFIRRAFYRVNRLIGDSEIILDMAEFALIAARVRDVMLANDSTYPFLRTEAGYVGFNRKGIPYKRQPRSMGTTHYNFIAMIKFAIGGILSSSTFPLRLAAYLALPLLILNVILLGFAVFGDAPKALPIMIGLNSSYVVGFIATICLYTARIYKNGIARPIYIIDWNKSKFRCRDGKTQ